MQIQLVLNKRDRLAFHFHHILKAGVIGHSYWVSLVAQCVILHVIFIGFKLPELTRAALWREVLILGVAWLANHLEQYYGLAYKIRKLVWQNAQTRLCVEEDNGGSLLRLTPEELIEINGQDQHERRHPWANVEGVYETAQHIFIYLAPAMAEIIPKRLFPAAQEAQQFLQQARQYWQQANPEKQPDLKVKRIPWAMRLTQFDLAPPVWALVVLLLFGALYSVLLVRGFYSMGKFFRQTARPEYSMDYAKLLRQAELMEDKEDWQEAAVLYQRLVALEPKNPAGHLGLGSAYSQREKYAEAETSYRAALALNPQAARAAYGMGYVAYIRAQYAEAEQWFQRCLQQDPEHLSANYFLGRVHQAQGKDTEAAQRFRAVLKENPFSDRAREAQKRLAEMRRRQGTGWFASTAVLPEL